MLIKYIEIMHMLKDGDFANGFKRIIELDGFHIMIALIVARLFLLVEFIEPVVRIFGAFVATCYGTIKLADFCIDFYDRRIKKKKLKPKRK